ncbi:MAG: lysoplasmalogenase family protein [Clostridiales bacterium]|nr:lysoplasmalogenase family protein [Clostridiales bacterium]
MQFVLIPFTICFLLYIRQENLYRFRTATALKITLTMTLAVCLIVALARDFSPVLLAAAVGMLLCSGGDFYLQYIRRDVRKFTRGIILFGLGQVCNITALFLLAPYHWSGLAVLAALLALAVALKGIGRWDTSANEPWLTIYTVLVAMTAAKSLSVAIVLAGKPGGLLLGLGGLLFFLSDMVLGIWNYRKNHILLADLNWLLYFAGQFLLCAGYIAAA